MNSRPAVWMLTFGDLLTLLLCFFLTIVSFGGLNPKANIKRSQALTQASQMAAPARAVKEPGTSFAHKDDEADSGVKKAPFLIGFEEHELTGNGLKSKLEGLLGMEPQRLTLKTCGADWNIAVKRALEAFESLRGLGLSPKVQVLGGLCNLLRADGKLAAVIVFE